jgi:MFS family permease
MRRPSFRSRSPLWHDRGFLRLWAANGVSQLGTQVTLLALPLTALYLLGAGPLGVSLLRSFAVLPFLLFSLPAGVWIDRLRRRRLMIAADVGRAAAMTSIPVAFWLGHLTMAQLYVVAGVHGLLSVIFDVSYLSFLPTLVGRPQLAEANAKLLGTQSLAGLAGPTLAGGLVSAVGAAVAVLADAVSFVFSAVFVTAIRGREPRPEPTGTRVRTELAEGLRYVFSQPYLRTLTIWISVGNLFSSAMFALLVVYFVRGLHLGAATIGWLTAVINLGFIAAAFANGALARRFGIGPMIAYTGILSSLALIGIPAAPRSFPLPVLVASGIAGTFVGFFMNVNQLTLRQAITPHRLLGREARPLPRYRSRRCRSCRRWRPGAAA